MEKTEIILAAVYLVGFLICHSMLRIEHEAEGKVYTKLDRLLSLGFSLFSFATVILILVSTWFKKIGASGYWNKPVKGEAKE